jgi:hypothetical protein
MNSGLVVTHTLMQPGRQLLLSALLVACGSETQPRATSPDSLVTVGDSAEPPEAARAPHPGPLLLTPDGWGPLRIGMSRAEVVAAAGEDAHPDAAGGPDPERCDEFRPRNAPDGVFVMIEDGLLTRISVSRNTDISTPAGFRVGDSGTVVLDEYGARASIDTHPYLESPAKYITVWSTRDPQTQRRGIRYEIDSDGDVVFLRGGGPSIENVEGCV